MLLLQIKNTVVQLVPMLLLKDVAGKENSANKKSLHLIAVMLLNGGFSIYVFLSYCFGGDTSPLDRIFSMHSASSFLCCSGVPI